MDSFEVLVVDDDKSIGELVNDHFRSHKGIHIHLAESAKAAMQIVETNFFHLALVDMQLSRNTADGMGVFNFLSNNRPSCEVILLTAFPNVYRKELFSLLNPRFPQIRSAIDKADFRSNAPEVIEAFGEAWLRNAKTIVGVEAVAEELATKVRKSKVDITRTEIDFILSSILGQGEESRLHEGITRGEGCSGLFMHTIDLKPLEGGRSRSVVTAGRPTDDKGNLGIWCVMKVGPRPEIEQEYSRYRSYVHFSVALAHRVELLGHSFGDTCGAICYSFAGKSPDSVRSLYDIFKKEDDAAPYLRRMFGIENRELYGRRGMKRTLANYFSKTYDLEPRNIKAPAQEILQKLELRSANPLVAASLSLVDVSVIDTAIANAVMHTPLETCIVHGDMNAGNVIVSEEDGRVIYIDYARSGCGPRSVDFAALEASVRLSTCPEGVQDVLAESRDEGRLWKEQWGALDHRPYEGQYWARVSATLIGYARENFGDLTEREYAATCLLWGARLFRVTQFSSIERLRILMWMNQCAARI
jgi:CheY-like chemotaxis protein